MATIFFLH